MLTILKPPDARWLRVFQHFLFSFSSRCLCILTFSQGEQRYYLLQRYRIVIFDYLSSLTMNVGISSIICLMMSLVLPSPIDFADGLPIMESKITRKLLRRTHSSMQPRELFNLPSPYEFYSTACSYQCTDDLEHELTPFLNSCPKWPKKYEASHCNHCCHRGSSSLKLRWHGCPGTIEFASGSDADGACGLERTNLDGSLRFVDCECYDSIKTPQTLQSDEVSSIWFHYNRRSFPW